VEVLCADVDAGDVEQLLPRLGEWAIDRLRVVSPRLAEPLEWVGGSSSQSVAVVDPEILTAPSAVWLTVWRTFPKDQLHFVRSIDLSALGELPNGERLAGSSNLESVTLPARLRILASGLFVGCPRLSHVGTKGCVALEQIWWFAFEGCGNLREFVFPSMIRMIDDAFGRTSIVCLDLSATRAKSVDVRDKRFLERLVLPRRSILKCACGLPALRTVTFGVCSGGFGVCSDYTWSPREVRFESLAAPAGGGRLWTSTWAFAEVGCVLGRESFPFPP
jgi:hypothetical protein